jgi:hypothetical protein
MVSTADKLQPVSRLVSPVAAMQHSRQMTPAQFKAKWAKFSGKENAAYQDHFADLCRMLGVPTPIESDPTGNDSFCFQKRVVKDAELFDFDATGEALPASKERGFADVWTRDCFGWEYKGPGEDLEKAYKQLLRYRESLLNPPLLIVCDFPQFVQFLRGGGDASASTSGKLRETGLQECDRQN